ncbi:MAG: hypothetical protein P4L45_03250 [Ignavibacteriaceae bacterium]|nr:hypothetical protein [Ignavibacteriaceae bacterium]
MFYQYSEESIFLLGNWQKIQLLRRGINNLENYEFTVYLESLEKLLKEKSWWDQQMEFVIFDNNYGRQRYFSLDKWRDKADNQFSIWIGVEKLTLNNLLGFDDSPFCYIWVRGSQKEIIKSKLLKLLENPSSATGDYILKSNIHHYNASEIIKGEPINEIVKKFEELFFKIKDFSIE